MHIKPTFKLFTLQSKTEKTEKSKNQGRQEGRQEYIFVLCYITGT